MVIKILSHNQHGCCIYADELVGFLKRMNQYKDGDEVQKWLQMWSGNSILLQRITRDESKVENPFCSIVGGIQPGVLETLSKEDNQHNGFYHRFLFVYPEPQEKIAWQPIKTPLMTKIYFNGIFETLLECRENKTQYRLSIDADKLYKEWFDKKNAKYNKATSDTVKGIIAKYQEYCLRFALILQVLYDFQSRGMIIEPVNMERAIRLTEYFFANMHKALKMLMPETPIDRLQKPFSDLYNDLPRMFTVKNVLDLCVKHRVSEASLKMFISRNRQLFERVERGTYEKIL
jgi:hypothetical protein